LHLKQVDKALFGHRHFVVVPAGDEWAAELPWIAGTATEPAGSAPSITVLTDGGQIACPDVESSVEAGRRVIVIAGSGRTADTFAAALVGSSGDPRAAALANSGLLTSVPVPETDSPNSPRCSALSSVRGPIRVRHADILAASPRSLFAAARRAP
jgi:SLOG in TRPM, prokaryote